MQKFFETLEQPYQDMLSNPDFQKNCMNLLNQSLQYQLLPAQYSERKIINQNNQQTLYHYEPLIQSSETIPLLIIYAFINKPSILDLQSDRSFIKKLLESGLDVYLLDWGNPSINDQNNNLETYIAKNLSAVIHKIKRQTKHKKINLLGICQGGVFSTIYSALYPANINKLITMVTPIDFHAGNNTLSGLLKNLDAESLNKHHGNIPGQLLAQGLQSLKPFRLLQLQPKYATLPPSEWEFFFRMEQWIQDCPDHPGLAFHEFITQFYQNNNLIKNQFYLGKKRINLKKLTMPILNIYAEQDHLISPASAQALKNHINNKNYKEIAFSGGHIGVFVSRKALESIPHQIAEWLFQE